jgi:TonB family protein
LPVVISEDEQKAERVTLDREILQRWITVAAVAFVLILAVALAKWIYTSPALDKIATPGGIRDIVANAFSSVTDKSEASENLKNTNPGDSPKAARPTNRETKTLGSSSGRNENGNSAADKRVTPFEIMDAKNERTMVPRKGANAPTSLPSANSLDVAEVSGGQPASGSLMQERGGSKVGLVLLHPSTEVPENKVLPEYPAMALQRNVQGRVVLKAMIGKDGRLQNVRLVGPPSLLSGPVLEAVKEWRYLPRYQNGVPVEVETQITIDFEINAK